MAIDPSRLIRVGRVAGAFGVKGEVRITAFTEKPAALLALARLGGVDTAVAKSILDRALTVAGTFAERAQSHPIRRRTVKVISAAIEGHRRMLG